ncbi:MAG TPA: TIM barrel protein [Acidobacteriaceae bacterium]|jgi:L-rhamnose isomerase/sugar isomerase|nr:TIM barrel protein [Acidobacteriaceae bacterium]
MDTQHRIAKALDGFRIEIPSWGFANTGTRFGKFHQPEAATSLEEKFADAAQVHSLTGSCPTLALHVEWDLPNGRGDVPRIQALERQHGVRAGSINPNLFERQEYKFGSICNPDAAVRRMALDHLLESVAIGKALRSPDVSVWLADGSNYPGTQSIRRRIDWMEEALSATHAALSPEQRLLIEYKPFEPAFYHTDIADWGMALLLARHAGPQAVVLVDTGHHYQGQNIEQIVVWLLREGVLGGFHFNDRRYADDDLTLGSIDPYQVFRIFHEILSFEQDSSGKRGEAPKASGGQPGQPPAYMIDQSHNLKGKLEAMVQTVCTAQEIYARAALVDRAELSELQDACRLVEAEECLRRAFWTDVRPAVRAWRKEHGLPEDPLVALRESGYIERIRAERGARNAKAVSSYA